MEHTKLRPCTSVKDLLELATLSSDLLVRKGTSPDYAVSENRDSQNISQKVSSFPIAHPNPQPMLSDTSCSGQVSLLMSLKEHFLFSFFSPFSPSG